MTTKRSAGILLYRTPTDGPPEVLLGHMGGPFWRRKDKGAWSIPKGEHTDDEQPQDAARREFTEELGLAVPPGELRPLGENTGSTGKAYTVWALAGEIDLDAFTPGTFEMEWPPKSGKRQEFPELDRIAWFDLPTAATKLAKAQRVFVERLADLLT